MELLGIFGIPRFHYRDEKDAFSLQKSFVRIKFLTETFMEQMKTVVSGKHEFEERQVSKLRTLFWKIRTIEFLLQGTKSKNFPGNGLAQIYRF